MNTIKIFISCNENINVNKKKVDPDLIFFTAQRSENISFIFSLVKIYRGYSNVWSEYDFYFIEWSEKMYISWVPKARMKYTFFHFTRWNKSHIHDKHLNFLFIIYITFDRRDANLAFARESLTRSFVPWRHDVHVLFCLVTLDMTSETRIGV